DRRRLGSADPGPAETGFAGPAVWPTGSLRRSPGGRSPGRCCSESLAGSIGSSGASEDRASPAQQAGGEPILPLFLRFLPGGRRVPAARQPVEIVGPIPA